MNKNIPIIIMGMLLSLLTGCQQYDGMENDGPVELSFKIATSSTATRGSVTDYPSTPSQWTQAERLVDGRYMYYLSVYIVNSENAIVASKENIEIDGQATEYTVTFDQSYGLKRGNYKLLAVANNTAHTIEGTTYNSGLVGAWESSDYESLMDNLIAGNATDNISSRDVVQPLSLVKDIELHAGNNVVDGELIRTFARIRIEIKNNSGTLPLQIKGLSFSDNFTQKQAYVFDDGTDRKYFEPTGAPLSTSSHALTPFSAQDIEAQTSDVIFDAYLLESKAADGKVYTYTLDLAYEAPSTEEVSFSRTNNTAIGQVDDLDVGDESYFLIYNTNSGRYLSAGESKAEISSLNDFANLGEHVVWQVIRNGSSYVIKNVNGKYLQAPGNGSVALGNGAVNYTLVEKEEKKGPGGGQTNYYIALKSNNAYVGVYEEGKNWNKTYNVQGFSNEDEKNVNFRFYKVTKKVTETGGGTITYNDPITLTTINPVTQQSSPATAIKRNDFINVLITVSYNPVAGKFEFVVQDWNTGGGEVEFN